MIKILVVDDSRLARKRIMENINKIKINHEIISEAENGVDALELFNKLNHDIVITDLEMPKMDGIELIQELRKINSSVDIIIISSLANEQVKQSLKSDRYLNFVKKPVKVNILELILLKIEHKILKGVDAS